MEGTCRQGYGQRLSRFDQHRYFERKYYWDDMSHCGWSNLSIAREDMPRIRTVVVFRSRKTKYIEIKPFFVNLFLNISILHSSIGQNPRANKFLRSSMDRSDKVLWCSYRHDDRQYERISAHHLIWDCWGDQTPTVWRTIEKILCYFVQPSQLWRFTFNKVELSIKLLYQFLIGCIYTNYNTQFAQNANKT